MSDLYKNFIRRFKAACAENRLSIQEVAEITRVGRTTVYNWFNFKSVMDGESMLRAIEFIMGGNYEKHRTLS